jgi:hypothetical protein
MCLKTKVVNNTKKAEVIKTATKADASVQKSSIDNRRGNVGLISENIKTTNNGLDDDVNASKKKLLGE